jgi:hypothetical protein
MLSCLLAIIAAYEQDILSELNSAARIAGIGIRVARPDARLARISGTPARLRNVSTTEGMADTQGKDNSVRWPNPSWIFSSGTDRSHAVKWMTQRFPQVERQIRDLARQHRELRDEPLHLAMAYEPGRESRDIFLFELAGNFGGNEVSPDAQLFEVTFDSTPNLPMEPGQRLHLVLTNPKEFRAALDQHWQTAEEVRDAVRRRDFEVLHSDEIGQEALRLLFMVG